MKKFFELMERILKDSSDYGTYREKNKQIFRMLMRALNDLRTEAKGHAQGVTNNPELASFYRGRWDGLKTGALATIDSMVAEQIIDPGRWSVSGIHALFMEAVRTIEDHEFEFGPPEIGETDQNK